jgi:peptidoglycan/LPS O-acetylase OafA/YrhL
VIQRPAAPAYRPDIDGLRAIAVTAVVLYHSGVPGFAGGYVGVDVFFVISGYLITGLLTSPETESLRIPLSAFYLRRARRILPALFLTCLATTLGAAALLLPFDLQRFGKYLAATSLFASNVPAWLEHADYFDRGILYVPLTHFWSIAVEEQFYLLYPLALLMLGRLLPGRRAMALALFAAGSFALCVWASWHKPIANFYLAPTRAWELLLGALLTAAPRNRVASRVVNECLAMIGILALAICIARYQPSTRYPGLYTLVPCLATALLIWSGAPRPSVVHRVLSLPPLVFTGLISFSIYLWHLPILLLVAYFWIEPLGRLGTAGLLAAVYLASVLTWKFVEQPIRTREICRSDRTFVRSVVALDALLLIIGIGLWTSNGFPQRYSAELSTIDQDWASVRDRTLKCGDVPLDRIAAGDLCRLGPATASGPAALVWGDSHAMVLLPAYEKLATERGIRIDVAIEQSCRPLLGVTQTGLAGPRQIKCEQFNAAVAQAIERLRPDLVILNAHWIDADDTLKLHGSAPSAPQESNFMRGLEETLRIIGAHGPAVCAVLDVPLYAYSVPYAVGMARRRGVSEGFLAVTRAAALRQFRGPEHDFEVLKQRGLLKTVDPKDALCRGEECIYEFDRTLLYSDRDHLSVAGAHFLLNTIADCFR